MRATSREEMHAVVDPVVLTIQYVWSAFIVAAEVSSVFLHAAVTLRASHSLRDPSGKVRELKAAAGVSLTS